MKFKIENIVASINIGEKLDLNQIVFNLENTEYEPSQFPGVILKLKNPKVTLLIFSTGKLVCTGAKGLSDLREAGL